MPDMDDLPSHLAAIWPVPSVIGASIEPGSLTRINADVANDSRDTAVGSGSGLVYGDDTVEPSTHSRNARLG
jgi:hypothetical protein